MFFEGGHKKTHIDSTMVSMMVKASVVSNLRFTLALVL